MLTDIQKEIVKILQVDLPETPEPFKEIANQLGLTEQILLDEINFLLREGYIKRMGAVLAHRRIGLNFNPMIVMQVNEKDIEGLGEKIAGIPEVTHCYQRPRLKDFPYDLYAMIHCTTEKDVDELVKKITSDERVNSYQLLFSTKEYKKTSMKYFQ